MRDPRSTPVACLLCRKKLHVAIFSLVLSDIDDHRLGGAPRMSGQRGEFVLVGGPGEVGGSLQAPVPQRSR